MVFAADCRFHAAISMLSLSCFSAACRFYALFAAIFIIFAFSLPGMYTPLAC